MEKNNHEKINSIVKEMILLLEHKDQGTWAKVLANILVDYQNPDLKKHAASLFVKLCAVAWVLYWI